MGLDMYAYAIPRDSGRADVDVEHVFEEKGWEKIHSWRKHPDLHGWMEKLYREKGGKSPSFNCATVKLTVGDLDALEADIRAGRLPKTTGFFFGESNWTDHRDDEFIELARRKIRQGFDIYYDSWW